MQQRQVATLKEKSRDLSSQLAHLRGTYDDADGSVSGATTTGLEDSRQVRR